MRMIVSMLAYFLTPRLVLRCQGASKEPGGTSRGKRMRQLVAKIHDENMSNWM